MLANAAAHLSTISTTTPLPSFLKTPIKIHSNWTIIKNGSTYKLHCILSVFSGELQLRKSAVSRLSGQPTSGTDFDVEVNIRNTRE
ncbi:hypothetical protein DKX38_007142 [Salix brachista]|uniref:Uncharacterized protein n=1 Tax=Salix brachista TaxID=2182728 RepID=A0A5N5MPA3_9ROSI|nr:hypothetical protein DKX38_007142 [Salix brachista]